MDMVAIVRRPGQEQRHAGNPVACLSTLVGRKGLFSMANLCHCAAPHHLLRSLQDSTRPRTHSKRDAMPNRSTSQAQSHTASATAWSWSHRNALPADRKRSRYKGIHIRIAMSTSSLSAARSAVLDASPFFAARAPRSEARQRGKPSETAATHATAIPPVVQRSLRTHNDEDMTDGSSRGVVKRGRHLRIWLNDPSFHKSADLTRSPHDGGSVTRPPSAGRRGPLGNRLSDSPHHMVLFDQVSSNSDHGATCSTHEHVPLLGRI